jgi:hypothetical protein
MVSQDLALKQFFIICSCDWLIFGILLSFSYRMTTEDIEIVLRRERDGTGTKIMPCSKRDPMRAQNQQQLLGGRV